MHGEPINHSPSGGIPVNVLLTSVGRRTYLLSYFQEAIRGYGSVHVSNSVETLDTQAAPNSFISPEIYSDDYIPALLDYCKRTSICAIVPLLDPDVLVLGRHCEDFRAINVRVLSAPEEAALVCNDKWRTFECLTQLGLGTPRTCMTLDDAKRALRSGELTYPVMLKPRWGCGSIGIYSADDENELDVLYQKSARDAFNSLARFESSLTPDTPVVIQQRLAGQEHGIDVLNDLEGNYVISWVKKKIAMRAGETDIGETMSPRPFEDIARTLSARIGQKGLLSVDCFVTNEGFFVTDLNCRISGHYPLSHLAGVDLPRQIVKWLAGEGTDGSLLCCEEGVLVAKDLVPKVFKPKRQV